MIRTLPLLQAQPRRLGILAESVGVLALVAAALLTRLVNLEAFVGKFDEGIRGEQLLLMAAGFRPFRDIFASQGPLSLDVFYPTFMLFGQTLGAARLAPALLSVVGLLATAWAARLIAGPVAAGAAAVVLLLSPTYLKGSRLALVEVPALVPAIVAVSAALAYQRSGNLRWLVAAGILFSLAVLIKPMVLPAVVPIGLAILLRGRGWLHGGLLFGAAGLLVAAIVIAMVGPSDVYDQMVRFRLASRRVEGWSLKENWTAMMGELADEQLVLYGAAATAAVLLLVTRPRIGIPLIAWPIASFGLLMVYSPLQFKHAVIMLPPLALLVGAGVGELWAKAVATDDGRRTVDGRTTPSTFVRRPSSAFLVALTLWYLASLPAILTLDRRVVLALPENPPESYDDEIALIPSLAGEHEFIVVDEPSVAFAARRLVPPSLVDTSMVRIRSRSLDAGAAIDAVERYDVKLLFLFSDGLRSIRRFADWVDEQYVAVKINERRNGKDRALYLRHDADLDAARAVLERTLERPSAATFGGQLRLLGHRMERGELRPGGGVGLTLGWQSIAPISADYHILTILRDARGEIVEQNERGLGGGGEGTASWEVGRWVFRHATLSIPSSTPSGEYHLSVAVYDSRAKQRAALDGAPAGIDTDELPIATIQVRG